MRIEHLEEVKERIADIRRRFIDDQTTSGVNPALFTQETDNSFQSVLNQAQAGKTIPCPEEIEPMIARAAEKNGVDPAIIKAVVRAESGFRNDAVSRVGAVGLMQLMPGTARALGVDPTDPEQNIDGGTRYLKQQIDKFGSLDLALAAYNAGPGSVTRFGGVPPYTETQKYVGDVMHYVDSYSKK